MPADRWGLSERGRQQADALAAADWWAGVDLLLASDERKAVATAEPAARRLRLSVVTDPGLREVRRPAGRLDDFAGAVLSYLEGGETPAGWEPRDAAAERFREALESRLTERPGAMVAVVSHGTVMTLYLTRLLGLDRPFELWRSVGFATCARVDPRAPSLLRGFT